MKSFYIDKVGSILSLSIYSLAMIHLQINKGVLDSSHPSTNCLSMIQSRCSILIPTMWSLPHPHIINVEPLTHLEQLNVEPLTHSEQLNLELVTHSEHFNSEPLTFSQRCIARAIELFLFFSG